MAKKAASDGGVNKSDAIRSYKEANPTAGPTEVAKALSEQGVSVSAGFVSTVLSAQKRKAKKARRGGRRGGRPRKAVASAAVSLEALKKAKQMAEQLGGVAQAQAALEAYAKLMG